MVIAKKRRLLALAVPAMLALALLFVGGPAFADTSGTDGTEPAAEENVIHTDDGWYYEAINSDGTAMAKIVGYDGGKQTLNIPNEIDGLRVMSFGIDADEPIMGESYSNVKRINYPKNLIYTKTGLLGKFENLQTITVADGNKVYKADANGVLYKKLLNGGWKVACYPHGKTETEWKIPDYVTEPYPFFYGCPLEKVTLSAGQEAYASKLFDRLESLQEIIVPAANPSFSSEDGVLFDKDKTKLLRYPVKKAGSEYTVPEGVQTIGDNAFRSVEGLTNLTLPASIAGIEGKHYAFYDYVESVTFTGKKAPDAEQFYPLKVRIQDKDNSELNINYPEDSIGYPEFIAALKSKSFAKIPETCEELKLNQEAEANIDKEGKVVTYKFIPEQDGCYFFESEGTDYDPVGCVVTEDGLIAYNDDTVNSNFQVFFRAKAGETYYLQSKLYEMEDTGIFTIRMANADVETIKSGQTVTVQIEKTGSHKKVIFSCEDDGTYYLGIRSDQGEHAYRMRDIEGQWVEESDYQGSEAVYNLTAGQEYVIDCYFSEEASEPTGAITVELSDMPMMGLARLPKNPEMLTIGEDQAAEIAEPGEVVTYAFAPEKSDNYYIELKDISQRNCLETYVVTKDSLVANGEDGIEGSCRTYFSGTEGETYYIQTRVYNEDAEQPVTFKLNVAVDTEEPEEPDIGFAPISGTYNEMELNQDVIATVENGGDVFTWQFTPEKAGRFYFESDGEIDTKGCVLTKEKEIAQNDDSPDAGDSNFRAYFDAAAGQTYYLQAKCYDNNVTGAFTVRLCEVGAHEHDLDQLPHTEAVEATCENSGNVEYWYCNVCGKYLNADGKEIAYEDIWTPQAHEWDEGEVEYEADCYNSGSICYTCNKCGEVKYEDIEPLGHDWKVVTKEPTCEEEGYTRKECSRCGETEESEYVAALGHDMTKVEAKKATCEEAGNVAYWHCSRCNNNYEVFDPDEADYAEGQLDEGEEVIPAFGHDWDDGVITEGTCTEGGKITYTCENCGEKDVKDLEAAGHSLKHMKAVPATCTMEGHEEYWICTVCGEMFSDAEGKNPVTEDALVTEVTGHTLEKVAAQEPTCGEPGYAEHWKCSECGWLFANEDDTERTYEYDLEIEPTGDHSWGEWEVTVEATEESTGEQTRTCSVCGETETETIGMIIPEHTEHVWDEGEVIIEPGCETKGTTRYTCTVCGETEDREDIPDLGGHKAGEAKKENEKKATCLEPGYYDKVVRCKECDFLMSSEPVEVPALGHLEGEIVKGKEATCTETGLTEGKKCSRCEEILVAQEVIPALGHEEVTIPAKPATCTETGLTEGTKCSRCNEILKAQEEVKAKGHSWNDGEVTKPATCKDEGVKTYTCTACGETKTEPIEKTDVHTWDDGKVTTEATCTTAGEEVYTCKVCEKTRTEVIGALGHKEEILPKKAATCTETGLTEGKKCSRCNEILVAQEEITALGHDEVAIPAKAATCTETGQTEGKKCSRCETVLTKPEPIPAFGHTWDEGVVTSEPTYDKEGVKTYTCETCKETRTEPIDKLVAKAGAAVKVAGGATVTVENAAKATVVYTKAPNAKNVTVPDTVKIGGKAYKITTIKTNAFKGSKATGVTVGANIVKMEKKAFNASKVKTLTVKSKKLNKKTVKGSLKGSKVKTVKVKVGKKKDNKKFVKKYKKIFTKKIVGKKVTVK